MTWTGLERARRTTLASLLGLAACGGADLPRTQAEAVARGLTPPQGQFVTVDGRQVHAHVSGPTDAPAVILLHGASGNLRDFTFDLAPRLATEFRVLAFDRPGLGYSDALGADGGSPAAQARHLAAAARQLGVTRAVVVGHSYGGAVALAWALDMPEQTAAVVSLAGAANPWPGGLGPWYGIASSRLGGATVVPAIAAFAPRRLADQAVEGIFEPDPVPGGYLDHVGVDLTLRSPVLRINARQVNGLKPHVTAMQARYPGLTLPVEILHGDRDTIVPLAIHSGPLAEALPNARLTVLRGVGHMPHHARPDETVAAIRRAAARAGLR